MATKRQSEMRVPYMWTAPAATLKKIYQHIDLDSDGHITEEEGIAAGRAITGSPELGVKWWESIKKLDDNDNQTVELEEFVNKQIQELISQQAKPMSVNSNLQVCRPPTPPANAAKRCDARPVLQSPKLRPRPRPQTTICDIAQASLAKLEENRARQIQQSSQGAV